MGNLAITRERILTATNMARQMSQDDTGEFNYPSLAYCVGVAVSSVFHTSVKSKTLAGKQHHYNAKTAVWNFMRDNSHLERYPKDSKPSHYEQTESSCKDDWPEDHLVHSDLYYGDEDYRDPEHFVSP